MECGIFPKSINIRKTDFFFDIFFYQIITSLQYRGYKHGMSLDLQ